MAARPLVHGHRGARAVLPENTIPAFEYAIQVGADAVEMDVAVSSDNVPVISHDPHINSGLAIHQLRLAELKLPTLDQVLSLSAGNRVHFNIEIKSFPDHPELTPPPDGFAALVLEVIQKRKLEPRCIVQSFDFRILHEMKRDAPAIRRAALWEGPARPFVEIAQEAGAGIIAPEFTLVTPEQVRAAHAAKLEVIPWTANTPEDWRKLIDAGVDAIITDDPAALIAYLRTWGWGLGTRG
jgi:glycerophosphoryl diester phosphodiesterase